VTDLLYSRYCADTGIKIYQTKSVVDKPERHVIGNAFAAKVLDRG